MTRDQLKATMSYAEFVDQMAEDTLQKKEAEKQARLNKKGMQQKRPRKRR